MHQLPDRFRSGRIRIAVAGAGGNGSMLLPHLARIHKSLLALGRHEGFEVAVFDPDCVSESNLGRQAYSPADVGRNKAVISVERINLFFGLDWEAIPERICNRAGFDIMVSCVDNLATRRNLSGHSWANHYWLDLGNGNSSGQVVLGGCGLPTLFELHPALKDAPEETDTPSCSVAEALSRQDLFINSTLANLAGQLLWKLLRTGALDHHGFYVNLTRGLVRPIPVAPLDATRSDPPPCIPTPEPVGIQRRRTRPRKRTVRRGRT